MADSFSPLPDWLRNMLPLALIGAASIGIGLASRVFVGMTGRVLVGCYYVCMPIFWMRENSRGSLLVQSAGEGTQDVRDKRKNSHARSGSISKIRCAATASSTVRQ